MNHLAAALLITATLTLSNTTAGAQYRLQQPLQPPAMRPMQPLQPPAVIVEPMQPLQMAPLEFAPGPRNDPQHCRMIRRRGGYNEGDETVTIDCY